MIWELADGCDTHVRLLSKQDSYGRVAYGAVVYSILVQTTLGGIRGMQLIGSG